MSSGGIWVQDLGCFVFCGLLFLGGFFGLGLYDYFIGRDLYKGNSLVVHLGVLFFLLFIVLLIDYFCIIFESQWREKKRNLCLIIILY